MGRLVLATAFLALGMTGGGCLPSLARAAPQAGAVEAGVLAQAQVTAPKRSALVIGNGAYGMGRLANAVNDAEEVARVLREIGFEVTLLRDANKRALIEAVEAFRRRLERGEIGLFYFSGHGLQIEGQTYLVPVDAALNRPTDAQYDAVNLGKVIGAVEDSDARARIFILDACRNNPFTRRWRSATRGWETTRGLAAPLPSGAGTLIAFSTAPDQVAVDLIDQSGNSPFTSKLLRHLRTPDLELRQLLTRVRRDVAEATRNAQIPWVNDALMEDIVLNPRQGSRVAVEAAPPPTPAPPKPPFGSEVVFPRFVFQPERPGSGQAPAFPPAPASAPATGPPRSWIAVLRGHTQSVNSVAFSPDGRRLVSGSGSVFLGFLLGFNFGPKDHTLRLWDAATGKPIGPPLQGHTNPVTSVAFSPDGRRILSGSGGFLTIDKTLRLWDAATGKPIGPPLQGHTNSVLSVAFSPDGRRIVSGSVDNTLRLWDAATGKPIGPPLQGHTSWVYSVAFSPDGRRLVSGSWDNTLRLWDAATGKPIGPPLQGHTNYVRSVAFSPDGRRIVSGSDDKTLRLWDAATGKPIGPPLQGHTSWVTSVAFSPDGRRLVSGSGDNTLRLWDAATGKPILFPR